MDEPNKLAQKILGRVFGEQLQVQAQEFFDRYLQDIKQPVKVQSALTGKPYYTSMPGYDSYVGQQEVFDRGEVSEWMMPKVDIGSLDELNELLTRFDFMQASRTYTNSNNVYRSDDVGESHHIYDSLNVIKSSYIVRSSWIWESEYLFGCMRSGESTHCIVLVEGTQCTDSYRVFSSRKVTRSMFIKSCYDVTDCLWCAHISGKQYCIANMQYTKDEYEVLKARILKWVFET